VTVGVWTIVAAKGRDSRRGPWIVFSSTGSIISVGIECGWTAIAGNGLLEMPIPLRINSPMSL